MNREPSPAPKRYKHLQLLALTPDKMAAKERDQEAVRGIGIVPPLSDQRNPQKLQVVRSQKYQEEQDEQIRQVA
jgi:hypothetical protein